MRFNLINPYLKKIYWACSVPLTSNLGYVKLKKISEKRDSIEWEKSFNNKKVLIVGTGPSLDKVNDEYFSDFDVIIYINHAIKCANKVKDEYFFSTDIKVVQEIFHKSYFDYIKMIGNEKCILAPIFFQQVLLLNKEFRGSFSWIVASQAKYQLYRMNKTFFGFKIPVTTVYWPNQPKITDLDLWYLKQNQVNFFPVIESTSALSAILFAAKYNPVHISLIGCDFNLGRSEKIKEDCPSHTINVFNDAVEKFKYLKQYLKKKNISLSNDSWS